MTKNSRPVEKGMKDLRARRFTVFVGKGRLKGAATRWGVRVDRDMVIPVPRGFYDLVAMGNDAIHLSVNLADGSRFDPDDKHGYLVRKSETTHRALLAGAELVVAAVLRSGASLRRRDTRRSR